MRGQWESGDSTPFALSLRNGRLPEVLPIGVLHPGGNHVLIAQVGLILQVVQRNHQTRRDARRPQRGMVTATQSRSETIPIDLLAETNEWMVQVNQLLDVDLKQLALWLLRFTPGAHRIFPVIVVF